jgi:glutathione synthase/RimK-type ligase-like ATP-grasp enzyme
MRRCAFLTLEDSTGYVIDDELAYAPLAALGWQVDTISWQRTNIEWHDYDAVVIRSTWDYVNDPDAFLDVLAQIERSGTPLFNGLDLVRWNIRKTYLRDLAERGVPVVPTIWRDRLRPNELPELIEEVGTAEVVIKPVVGLNARGAFRLDAQTARSRGDELCAYYADRAFLVQPFLSAITTEGEFSLFYFNGVLSHTILKTPKAADFRVQEEHGGVIRAVETDAALREAGDAALRAIGAIPLYVRADFVRANDASILRNWRGEELSTLNQQPSTSSGSLNRSTYWLMELELIEPSLYLRMDKAAPERFARALHERVLGALRVGS